MVRDMIEMSGVYPAVTSILRYLIACYNYNIHSIIVGEKPYPSAIVPTLGASYSQTVDSSNTPTIEVISAHFRDEPMVVDAIRNSWRLLQEGYLFLNAYYSYRPDSDVLLLERVEMTTEFICTLCEFMASSKGIAHITLMSIGTTAKYVVSQVCNRLQSNSIRHTSIHTIQPAAYHKYMNEPDKVGVQRDYMCFTPSGMVFMRNMIQGYMRCVGLSESDINMSQKPAVSELLSSLVQDLITESDAIQDAITESRNNIDLEARVDEMTAIQERTNTLINSLLCTLHTNAFITAVVSDNVVLNAPTSTAPTNRNVPMMVVSNPSPAGNILGIDSLSNKNTLTSGGDAESQVTMSITDLLTPRSLKKPPAQDDEDSNVTPAYPTLYSPPRINSNSTSIAASNVNTTTAVSETPSEFVTKSTARPQTTTKNPSPLDLMRSLPFSA